MRLERRSFITLSALALAGAAAWKGKSWLQWSRKRKVAATFLTHSGKLVEINLDKVPFTRKRISKNQLVSWIWKEQKL